MINKLKKIALMVKNLTPIRINSLTSKQTIELMIREKKGIIRWGDGETNLATGSGQFYQKADNNLRKELMDILVNYSNDKNYILALPNDYLNKSVFSYDLRRNIIWSKTRNLMRKHYNGSMVGNAFIFRDYITKKGDIITADLVRLWEPYKYFIIISGNEILFEFKEIILKGKKQIFTLKVDSKDCYDSIDSILSEVKKIILENNCSITDTVLLVSAGPAAKAIVNRASHINLCGFDVGYLLDPNSLRNKYKIDGEIYND